MSRTLLQLGSPAVSPKPPSPVQRPGPQPVSRSVVELPAEAPVRVEPDPVVKRSAPGPGQRGGERFHELDFARAVLFSLGLVLHAAYLCQERSPGYGGIFSVIHSFRMEGFFVVAGFFAAWSLTRQAPHDFLRKRLVRLGVPLMVCAVGLNALVNLVAIPEVWTQPSMVLRPSFWLKGRLHQAGHLWFLGTLIVYVAAAYGVHRLVPGIGERLREASPGPWRFLLVITGGYLVLSTLARVMPVPPWGKLWIFVDQEATLRHLAFFVSGYLFYSWRGLWDGLVRYPWVNACVIGMFWGVVAVRGLVPFGGWAVEALRVAYVFSVCGLLVLLARRLFSDGHPAVRAFAEGSYTVYLVHWPAMVLLNAFVGGAGLPEAVTFFALIVVSGLVAWCVHATLVLRHPWFAFLFNGVVPRGGGAGEAAPSVLEVVPKSRNAPGLA